MLALRSEGPVNRQQAYQDRLRAQGLVQVTVWIPEALRPLLLRFAERLRRRVGSRD